MERKEALRLLAENPGGLLELFAISRDEVLTALAAEGIRQMRAELGGTLVDWFPLTMKQASFVAGGAERRTLLKGEHFDFGDRSKSVTLGQALRVQSRSLKNAEIKETPAERVIRLRKELATAEEEMEVAS